jgi:argininosuccinate synthase
MAYDPAKLSMEKVASAFTPEDRIGALEMQNLAVGDNRALLLDWMERTRRIGPGATKELGGLLGTGDDDGSKS